jgi:hypothetical protein
MAEQDLACGIELHAAARAFEQWGSHLFFERLELATEGRL